VCSGFPHGEIVAAGFKASDARECSEQENKENRKPGKQDPASSWFPGFLISGSQTPVWERLFRNSVSPLASYETGFSGMHVPKQEFGNERYKPIEEIIT
jgi:hypothetical protein